ncbi:SUMO-activating enzyme subunit 1-like isoform X1 [Rhopilema esculentum]|uniref:SUMO-activating enzyme subunit 1-like isoform X1 n=2 Tax=Rhopilema esculentum TaxID=499914 RepID=UPI0031E0C7B1
MHEEKKCLQTAEDDNVSKLGVTEQGLTEEEVAVYDRQIRLWGVESQRRLRKSRILICGLSGLGNEVSKNIILAGVQHLTVMDNTEVTKENRRELFLPSKNSIGQNKADAVYPRLHEMNPMVDLHAYNEDISSKPESFFENFDVVCLLDQRKDVQLKVNEICHKKNIKFLSGCVFGHYGYMFSDLGKHHFVEEKVRVDTGSVKKSNEPAAKRQKLESRADEDVHEMVHKAIEFKNFQSAVSPKAIHGLSLKQLKSISKTYFVMQVMLEFSMAKGRFPRVEHKGKDWKDLLDIRDSIFEEMQIDNDMLPDEFVSHCIGEVTAVSCIVGGILAQEIIKAVSGRDSPHNNFFFYDGVDSTGLVDKIGTDW